MFESGPVKPMIDGMSMDSMAERPRIIILPNHGFNQRPADPGSAKGCNSAQPFAVPETSGTVTY